MGPGETGSTHLVEFCPIKEYPGLQLNSQMLSKKYFREQVISPFNGGSRSRQVITTNLQRGLMAKLIMASKVRAMVLD